MWQAEPGCAASGGRTSRRVVEGDTPQFADSKVLHLPLDGEAPELDWLEKALAGSSRAVLWQTDACLVAPLSYRRHARLEQVSLAFARRGWPVRLRRSGGGVVPLGPGILNLSLAYAVDELPGVVAEKIYRHVCAVLSQALSAVGIVACAAAVEGSFCDGRFNLAVASASGLRKIAGTAPYWRRARGRQAVLAHALLLVQTDTEAITGIANEFETALGSGRRYSPAAVCSVAMEWGRAHGGDTPPHDLSAQLAGHIAAALRNAPHPRPEGDAGGPA